MLRFPEQSNEMNVLTILDELLEAIALQELALAHFIEAQSNLIKAVSRMDDFYHTSSYINLDISVNSIFQSFSNHEKWLYKTIILVKELKNSKKLRELNKESVPDNNEKLRKANQLSAEVIEQFLDHHIESIMNADEKKVSEKHDEQEQNEDDKNDL